MSDSIKLTVDAVVFGYEEGEISILLIKRKYEPFKGQWACKSILIWHKMLFFLLKYNFILIRRYTWFTNLGSFPGIWVAVTG